LTIHDFLGGLVEVLLSSVLCKDGFFGHLLEILLIASVFRMQKLALSRTCVQMNIITVLSSLPRKELEFLNFRCFTTVPEEVLSSEFGLNSASQKQP
jgi:hypothetical protein